jgi:hypothetical protein
MSGVYVHHRVTTAPRQWQAVADDIATAGADRLKAAGGTLYGIWRSQIGRPRDELAMITAWPDDTTPAPEVVLKDVPAIRDNQLTVMTPTLRPDGIVAPRRQGNYAFRWFETPIANWDEFLDLCGAAWPGFESAYDSQVIGLWRVLDEDGDLRRSLLLTRRPSLAMWERSKIPEGEAEAEVRRKLSRRYDLCDWTCVYTTTLLTAEDQEDKVRWT